jgi:hypothetical protein
MDERTQFMREQKAIEDLAYLALDEAISLIQQKLGVTDGDLAGHFFSDGIVHSYLENYISQEMEELNATL